MLFYDERTHILVQFEKIHGGGGYATLWEPLRIRVVLPGTWTPLMFTQNAL